MTPVALGTRIVCITPPTNGDFTKDRIYRVNAYQVVGDYAGVRVRDDKRQRKDFNFIPTSKNYFWKYFSLA